MSSIDLFVLLFYVIGVFAIGVLFSSRTKNTSDMFAANGQAPWWASGLSGFMTMFSAGTFVVWGGIAYKLGLVAIMINLCYGVAAMLVGYFVVSKWNQLGISTPAEFVELRFNRSVLHFYTWSMLIFRILGVGVALYSLAILMVALIPLEEGNPLRDSATGNLSVTWAIIGFGGIVVLYTMLGGLWAVLMTDVLQFVVLNLSVLFMVPLILMKTGGIGGLSNSLPEGFFDPIAGDYTWFFLAGWVAIHFFMIGAEWAFVQRHICVANPREARKATYLFGILYLISPFVWLLPPLAYRAINADANPEQAYILSCQEILPAGMIGLMLAAMFSATASMVSSQLNVFAGVLTENVFRKLRPATTDAAAVNAGRFFSFLLGAVLIGVAIGVPYLGGAEKIIIAITSLIVTPLLAPTIWGLFSKRISTNAVWATVAVVFVVGLIVNAPLIYEKQVLGRGVEELSKFSATIASWGKYPEMIIGVVLPILMLSIFTFTSRTTAIGWERVEKRIAELGQRQDLTSTEAIYDTMPAYTVAIALAVCGFLLLTLVLFSKEQVVTTVVFSVCLFALAATIIGFTRNSSRQQRTTSVLPEK